MAWAVDYYGTPPDAGGVLDQDMRTTTEMRVARNVYNAFDSMLKYRGDQKQWTEQYPTHWTIVARTQKLRMTRKKKMKEYSVAVTEIARTLREIRAWE